MLSLRNTAAIAAALLLSAVGRSVQAQIPVTDLGAIAQLVSEVNTLQQQLDAVRQSLVQAQQQYQSMTGARGMEQLLAGSVRNYMPTNGPQLQAVVQGSSSTFALGADVRTGVSANAVLTTQQIAALTPAEQDIVQAGRADAALEQAVAQEALTNSSSRFAAIQSLINAIPSATDQKGILELVARISAEQGMLQNEQTKLHVLGQAAEGAEWARRQRAREHAVVDIGSLRNLPAMGL